MGSCTGPGSSRVSCSVPQSRDEGRGRVVVFAFIAGLPLITRSAIGS